MYQETDPAPEQDHAQIPNLGRRPDDPTLAVRGPSLCM